MFRSICASCRKSTPTSAVDWRAGKRPPRCSSCGSVLLTKGSWVNNKPKKGKRRRPQMTHKSMKPSAQRASKEAAQIVRQARKSGIFVVVKAFSTGRRPTLHVMFNDCEGKRLVDYWPGNGTVKILGGQRTKAVSMGAALELAIVAARKPAAKGFWEEAESEIDREFRSLVNMGPTVTRDVEAAPF